MDGQAVGALKVYGVVVSIQQAPLRHNLYIYIRLLKGKLDHVFINW